jgi:hypothetical protein
MKTLLLAVSLTSFALVMVMLSVLRPSLGQYFALATLLLSLQIVLTYLVVNKWPPLGLTKQQSQTVIMVCLAVVLFLISILAALRQLPGLGSALAADSVVQTEAALDFLAVGKNPYVENYFATKLGQYNYDKYQDAPNPAFYHFVYLPSLLWLSYPIRQLSLLTLGFFDQRFTIMLALIGLVWLIWSWLKIQPSQAVWLAPLLITNPWLVQNLVAGQNDMIPLFLVTAGLCLWHKGLLTFGTILLAAAATTKQTVWFILPFAAPYLWSHIKNTYGGGAGKKFMQQVGWFAASAVILIMPFIVRHAAEFWQDTVGYILGTTKLTYPAWGLGLAELLYRSGVISERYSPFPFFIPQLIVGLPVLYYMLRKLKQADYKLSMVFVSWCVWLGASWVMGRFFAPHHLGFLISVAAVAFLISKKEMSNEPSLRA